MDPIMFSSPLGFMSFSIWNASHARKLEENVFVPFGVYVFLNLDGMKAVEGYSKTFSSPLGFMSFSIGAGFAE